MTSLFPDTFPEERSAIIEGEYRYLLTRRWAPGPLALWIMLNPSIADATQDDPTVRRLVGFTRREGLAGFRIVNHFALISPDPKALTTHPDPIGPRNGVHLMDALNHGDIGHVVCAWGACQATQRTDYALGLMLLMARTARPQLRISCLGRNADGSPKHPLYLASDEPLVEWPVPYEAIGDM